MAVSVCHLHWAERTVNSTPTHGVPMSWFYKRLAFESVGCAE